MGMDNLHAGDSLRVITPNFLTGDFYWQGILLDGENQTLPNTQVQIRTTDGVTTIPTDERGRFLFQQKGSSKGYQLDITSLDGYSVNSQFMPQSGRLVLGKLFYTPAAFRYLEANRQRRKICALLQLPIGSLPDVQQNKVGILNGPFSLAAYQEAQQNNWTSNNNWVGPIRPGWIWQPGLKTNMQGEVRFNYTQAEGVAAFRIDVVGQRNDGQRARSSLLYKVD
jgi:hypothetical protein